MGTIYQIKENIKNRIYVGSAKNFEVRKKKHLYELKNNRHHNLFLQRIYNKNGLEVISFTILEEFKDDSLLFQKERFWIDKLKPKLNIGSVSGGDNISKHPDRLQIIEKIKKSLTLRYSKLSLEDRKNIYGFRGYLNNNWKGGISKFYCSCGNFKTSAINKTCMRCRNISGDNNPFFGKKHSQESKDKIRNSRLGIKPINSRKVIIDSIVYLSATEASKSIGCTPSTILNRCNSVSFLNYNFYNA